MLEELVINKSRLFNCGKQPEKPEKERCFAHKHGKCTVLLRSIAKDCKTCPFFKTQGEYEKGRERALARLKTLDKPVRHNIAEKYRIKRETLNIPPRQSIDRGVPY